MGTSDAGTLQLLTLLKFCHVQMAESLSQLFLTMARTGYLFASAQVGAAPCTLASHVVHSGLGLRRRPFLHSPCASPARAAAAASSDLLRCCCAALC